jgi:hypothetical protein
LVAALAGLRARLNAGGGFVLFMTRRNPFTRLLVGRWWRANLYDAGELADSLRAAGFSRSHFLAFPPSARYLSLWGHVVEARR